MGTTSPVMELNFFGAAENALGDTAAIATALADAPLKARKSRLDILIGLIPAIVVELVRGDCSNLRARICRKKQTAAE
jgi:hypothetical protein